jgi:hypothetical protein
MSAAGIGIGVFGFTQPGIALSLLHPTGGAGCTLWVSQDLLTLLLPQGGTVTDELVIPANPALVGMTVLHQVLQLEFSGANLARISGSNGRSLTIGSY